MKATTAFLRLSCLLATLSLVPMPSHAKDIYTLAQESPIPIVVVSGRSTPFVESGISDATALAAPDGAAAIAATTGFTHKQSGCVTLLIDPDIWETFSQKAELGTEGIRSFTGHMKAAISDANRADDRLFHYFSGYIPGFAPHNADDARLVYRRQPFQSIEDMAAWALKYLPDYRLQINYVPSAVYPFFKIGVQDEQGLPVRDENGEYAIFLPDGLEQDYKERYDYIVTYRFESYQGDLCDPILQATVIQALNKDSHPGLTAPQILRDLATRTALDGVGRLSMTIKAARLDVYQSSFLSELNEEQVAMLRRAYYVDHVQSDVRYWNHALAIPRQEGNPAAALSAARIHAWGNSRETMDILSSLIRSGPLGDAEEAHIADTLRIFYLGGMKATSSAQ